MAIAACGSTSSSSNSGSSSSTGASVPVVTTASFNRDFTAMSSLHTLAAKGKGLVAAILPDTVSSARYTEFDAPFLTKAFQLAGLKSSQYIVENAQGSDATELSMAQSAISRGASVIIFDPLDSGVGVEIEKYAAQHGVRVINYDRLTLGSTPSDYYVSFNNVRVGQLIGQGFVACVAAWHVTHPNVLVMRGAPTDNNATLFAEGYDSVIDPYFKSGQWNLVGTPPGTWTPSVALTEFQQMYTAHPNINAVVTPNDENAAPIISYLQSLHIAPKTIPFTGQDATLQGLQNILAGYQCGTVYKPIYQEAQAAVSLALYLRAGETPPAALLNGTTHDPVSGNNIPSVLLTPEWVTTKNMASTVIADNFVPASQLCSGTYAAACAAAGIKA